MLGCVNSQGALLVKMVQAKILKKTLAKYRTLSPYWKNDLPPTTKGSNYELVVFWVVLLLPIPSSDIRNMNLFVVGGRLQYSVCVRSFEPLCGGRQIIFQYSDSAIISQCFFFILRIVFSLVPFPPNGHHVNLHIP